MTNFDDVGGNRRSKSDMGNSRNAHETFRAAALVNVNVATCRELDVNPEIDDGDLLLLPHLPDCNCHQAEMHDQ